MQGLCEICGMGWCGRPCLRDPKKSNALLFHPDGRLKTLHERGLGWDDPPLVTKKPKARLQVVSGLKGMLKESNSPSNESNKPVPAVAESNKPKFDRAAYQRELMRKRRAAKAAKPKKAKPQEFRG